MIPQNVLNRLRAATESDVADALENAKLTLPINDSAAVLKFLSSILDQMAFDRAESDVIDEADVQWPPMFHRGSDTGAT